VYSSGEECAVIIETGNVMVVLALKDDAPTPIAAMI
jgi:hypothetical protein